MSNPSALQTWALPRLSALLPLDEDSLEQIITYIASLSKDEAAEHLKNLLGDSAQALEFITAFNARRNGNNAQAQAQRTGNTGAQIGTENSRNNAGLAAPQQARDSSAASPRNQSPAARTGKGKAPPSASGPLISDYMPNVRSKAARQSTARQQHASASPSPSRNPASGSSASASTSSATTTTSNIADLTSAIAALELTTNPTLSKDSKPRKCSCNALIHPLFTPAPNCLSCGKIICALEGLQPCSFCGTPVLDPAQVQDMIRELKTERGNEKMRAHNQSLHGSGGPVSAFSEPAAAGGRGDSKLDAAKAHRDKLLSFQAQNARRTRVVDEAADFDAPNLASTQWMSPSQRALALKKQQRMMRELEEKSRPEWERKGMVMSLDVKSGRVVRSFQRGVVDNGNSGGGDAADAEAEDDIDDVTEDGAGTGNTGDGAFGRNPLLAGGGLVRPVWQPEKGTGERREQKQTWRRVQDDNDDNEQWILDGGLYGHDTEGGL